MMNAMTTKDICSTPSPAAAGQTSAGRLFVLNLSSGSIFSVNPDGSDQRVLVEQCRHPDGLAVDAEAGHIYWTNMGVSSLNDGSIERIDLDGRNRVVIVPEGGTFTPKQIVLEKRSGKLYWSDREGMRVMRANLDGSSIETLVDASKADPRPGRDATKWCVGVAVDTGGGRIYWTQKGPEKGGLGRIFSANLDIPKGQSAANRTDIAVLFDGLPEPIDLELDLDGGFLYWTDRGDPPWGNTANRAQLDGERNKWRFPEILITHLMEGIGIALDRSNGRMFLTDMAGRVYSATLDGSDKKVLLSAQGNLSGIAFAEPRTITVSGTPEKVNANGGNDDIR
jgi:sugar lactone lactonase YvrE